VAYLRAGLKGLPQSHQSLDASRPWLCYWVLHGLRLLGEPLEQEADLCTQAVEFLKRCQNADGGFGGGPGQVCVSPQWRRCSTGAVFAPLDVGAQLASPASSMP
jgi:hypothetical protein